MTTSESPIGFVDSGVGGLPYLARVRELLPAEDYSYYADRRNFPYGEKSAGLVREFVLGAVSQLVRHTNPKLVVVACNTASVVTLAELRAEFNIPFVGVVPAIKPAAGRSPNRRISVLATETTVEDPYTRDLVDRFASDCEFHYVAAGSLVRFVEFELAVSDLETRRRAIAGPASELAAHSPDAVVLGCTHFVHLRDELSELLGPGVTIVDSVEGVARQVQRICPSPRREEGRTGHAVLSVSGGPPDPNYRNLAARFGLQIVNPNGQPDV